MQQNRHPLLPAHLSPEELQIWIRRVGVEKFQDKTKRYFTPEEIQEFEHESSKNGRSINMLKGILAQVTEAVNKGTDMELTITVPATVGTVSFDKFRRQNDDLIDSGYEMIETEVFGIVDQNNKAMEYFTMDGQHIAERSRPLSVREKQQYLTTHQMGEGSGAKLSIDDSISRTGTEG